MNIERYKEIITSITRKTPPTMNNETATEEIKEIIIGDIVQFHWHYVLMKIRANTYGHYKQTYHTKKNNENNNGHDDDVNFVVVDQDLLTTINANSNYAFVYIKNNKIFVRNLFHSVDEMFGHKNTYFSDHFDSGAKTTKYVLTDNQNKLSEYLYFIDQEQYEQELRHILYFCVEFTLYEKINKDFIHGLVEMDENFRKKLKDAEKIMKLAEPVAKQVKSSSLLRLSCCCCKKH